MSSEVAKRYARALFRTADKNNQAEEHSKSFEAMEPLLKESSHFLHWMVAPQVAPNLKVEMIEGRLSKLCNRQLLDFFLLLLKKGRFQKLPSIAREYQRLVAKKLGMLDVEIITTVSLDEATKETLGKKLKNKFGLEPRMHEVIDPSILGGVVIEIGSKMIDYSIKGKLLRLKKHLLRGTA